jgi:hypothetical protein
MPADLSTMLDEIRRIAESLPARRPATLRIGPHVLPILRHCPPPPSLGASLPLGVPVVLDDDLPPGAWQVLDQHGEEMQAGNLWPPQLPVIESDLLPDGTHAIVFTPPEGDEYGPEACVIVRAAGLPTNQDRTEEPSR